MKKAVTSWPVNATSIKPDMVLNSSASGEVALIFLNLEKVLKLCMMRAIKRINPGKPVSTATWI